MTLDNLLDWASAYLPIQQARHALVDSYDHYTGCGRWSETVLCTQARGWMLTALTSKYTVYAIGGFVALRYFGLIWGLPIWGVRAALESAKTDKSYGDARLLKSHEAYREGLFAKKGVFLGDYGIGTILPLRVDIETSILTIGGAGSNKGSGLAITNCHSADNKSQIIFDPSGEITETLAPIFIERGWLLYCLNPSGLHGRADDGCNPLAWLDPNSPSFAADCRAMAMAACLLTPKDDPFWVPSWCGMLTFGIWESASKGKTDLPRVLSNLKGAGQDALFKNMTEHRVESVRDEGHKLIAMKRHSPKMLLSILETGDSKLSWVFDPSYAASLRKDGPNLDHLRGLTSAKGCVISVIVPTRHLEGFGAYAKFVMDGMILQLAKKWPKRRVTLLVDEANSLGRWELGIERGVTELRKYNIRLHTIWHSAAQITELYREKYHSIMSSSGVKNYVGVDDLFTAREVSERCGSATVRTPYGGSIGRRLFTPEQIMGLGRGVQLSFIGRIQFPILVTNRPWFHRPELRVGMGQNPYYDETPGLPAMYPIWLVKGWLLRLYAMARPTKRQLVIGSMLTGFYFWGRTWAGF